MKYFIYLLLLFPSVFFSQLKLEWKKEFSLPDQKMVGITGLFQLKEDWFCSPSNLAVTKIQKITNDSEPVEVYTIPNYVWWYAVENKQLWSREGNCMHQRDIMTGNVINTKCYNVQEDWPANSPVSCFYKQSFYYAEFNILCKFDQDGDLVFKKQVAANGTPSLISKGAGKIFIYGLYGNTNTGHLMQYDTLGNQKWSIVSGDVRSILADNTGNCYAAVANGESTLQKYDAEGKVVWSTLIKGQFVRNMSLMGDSIFVCGNISLNAMTDQKQSCAYSIISATSGKILTQQIFTLYEDRNEREFFSQIASDGKDIYIGGSYGWQFPTCFLVKLSKEGNTTSINENITGNNFSIYPNPSGSKFTIACEDANVTSLKVTVRNSLGQVVQKKEIECSGQKTWEMDLVKQAAGNYTIEIVSGKERVVKKVVVE